MQISVYMYIDTLYVYACIALFCVPSLSFIQWMVSLLGEEEETRNCVSANMAQHASKGVIWLHTYLIV